MRQPIAPEEIAKIAAAVRRQSQPTVVSNLIYHVNLPTQCVADCGQPDPDPEKVDSWVRHSSVVDALLRVSADAKRACFGENADDRRILMLACRAFAAGYDIFFVE